MSIKVAIIMGSKSDWEIMSHSGRILSELNISHESKVISAHRTPDLLDDYCSKIEEEGVEVIIAGAGLAAALPGVIASKKTIPVIGVPLDSGSLSGLDALLSIVQMPPGIPVGTMGVGKCGAINAALFAASILSLNDKSISQELSKYRKNQAQKVIDAELS